MQYSGGCSQNTRAINLYGGNMATEQLGTLSCFQGCGDRHCPELGAGFSRKDKLSQCWGLFFWPRAQAHPSPGQLFLYLPGMLCNINGRILTASTRTWSEPKLAGCCSHDHKKKTNWLHPSCGSRQRPHACSHAGPWPGQMRLSQNQPCAGSLQRAPGERDRGSLFCFPLSSLLGFATTFESDFNSKELKGFLPAPLTNTRCNPYVCIWG